MKIESQGAIPVHAKPEPIEPRLMEAAKLYEQQFLREMVRAMRKTVPEGELVQVNMAEKIFREQLDDQYVEKWSEKGGLGFADLVYENIIEKIRPANSFQKPKGPVPLESKGQFQLENKPSSPGRATMKIEVKDRENTSALEVRAPWRGQVTGRQETEMGTVVVVNHENGLRSKLVFEGVSGLRTGQTVVAGARVGTLNPGASAFHWVVEPGLASVQV